MQAGDTALTALLKRDRVVVATSLAVVTLLAWAYVVWLSSHMAMPVEVPVEASEARDGRHGYGRRRAFR